MRIDVFGSVLRALRQSVGPFGGISPIPYASGKVYIPHQLMSTGVTVNTTPTRLIYTPYFVRSTQLFAGVKIYNQGAGDNAELIRLGVYNQSAGLPTSLVIDFGAVTLTGASAERTIASPVTLPGPAWYFLAYHAQTAAAMFGMDCQYVPSAEVVMNPLSVQNGSFSLRVSTNARLNSEVAMYVDTTYGALASTAVAPTDSIISGLNLPVMGLYV